MIVWIVGALLGRVIVENYSPLRYAAAHFRPESATRPVHPAQGIPVSVHTFGRRQLLQGALAAALPLGLVGCAGDKGAKKDSLIVGGLPVTCNLTLPVACVGKQASLTAGTASNDFAFEYSKYSGWPEIKESLMAGRIQAGYMLAPLVMDLADKKIPVKVVSLGHRSGAVIMVRTESPYQSFADLKGKRIAIPSRFAVDFLFLRKMLAHENMTPKDIEIMEMPPPDMPAALYANAVDAYCTGEPFGASAQRAGYARILRMTRDHWRNYICCVLTVRQELIDGNRPMVQDLVNQIQGAGLWLDETAQNRTKAVGIASGKNFFNQDPKILQYVMDNPVDRVTYGDLRMIREEFEDLMQLSIQAGTIKHPIPYDKYIDDSFVRAKQAAVIPL
jgi:NitT/TauT family transport system substrate-binding protein